MYTVMRYHDISCGHRVVGQGGKCELLHGHNYRVTFHVQASDTDSVGRVMDFGEIKRLLCDWLEEHWDHKFLAWTEDQDLVDMSWLVEGPGVIRNVPKVFDNSLVFVPFNPTAENMARYLCEEVAALQLFDTGLQCVAVTVEETRKCAASYEVEL